MVFPSVGEGTNVIDVDLCVLNVVKYIFHGLLGHVQRALEPHWQYVVSVLAKRCDNGHQIFGFFIQLKNVVLHRYVNLSKKGILWSLF